MFYIGCHLSVSDGYEAMGITALSIGANTFQYFTRNPRGRGFKRPTDSDVSALVKLIEENGFAAPLAHAPYTFNPASKEARIWDYSKDSMREDIEFLEKIPHSLYNFHPGSHVGIGSEAGIANTARLLNEVITPGQSTKVLIETMAGKGSEIGKTFEEVRAIMDAVEPEKREHLGVCLDTCHIWDGGYNIAEDTDAVLDEFGRVIGLENLCAIHLNDSKNPLGAAKDRHEKIGDGALGLSGITSIITNSKIAHLPFYLETPNELDCYQREIALLKEIRGE